MPRKAGNQGKNDIQKRADAAREAYKAAKERADKNPKDEKLKAALTAAKGARDDAETAENRDRFLRLAAGRTDKALTNIANVAACFNPDSYSFTQADYDTIHNAIAAELETLDARAKRALAGETETKERKKFSLGG